jgi:integrase/recombinase XerD
MGAIIFRPRINEISLLPVVSFRFFLAKFRLNNITPKRSSTMPVIAEAIKSYFIFKRAQRLSERTLEDYQGILDKFAQHVGEDREIDTITSQDVSQYLATLNVSKKRVKNVHISLSSLWTWAVQQGVCLEHIMRQIRPPKPERRTIIPLEQYEIERMLESTKYSFPYARPGKRECRKMLPKETTLRDRAILLFLLDTGVRASELCNLQLKHISPLGAEVHGKGAKDRIVPISATTLDAVNAYVSTRKRLKMSDYVFVSKNDKPLCPDVLRDIVLRIARRAGALRVHPHRFRHTFAINFLRNGGDAFSLQMILGHETMEMVRRYLAIAKSDIQKAHRKASPVTAWDLLAAESEPAESIL